MDNILPMISPEILQAINQLYHTRDKLQQMEKITAHADGDLDTRSVHAHPPLSPPSTFAVPKIVLGWNPNIK